MTNYIAFRIKGSSGFEHVFLGEKKNDKVQGFHNWLYFYYMEEKNKVLDGTLKIRINIAFSISDQLLWSQTGNISWHKSNIAVIQFCMGSGKEIFWVTNLHKIFGECQLYFRSMLIGTSPEFELALYTTCLLAHGEEKCKFSLGGRNVALTSHVFSR